MTETKPTLPEFIRARKEQIALEALKLAYLSHLTLPHGKLRLNRQNIMCALRDAIAELENKPIEDVQNEFSEIATEWMGFETTLNSRREYYHCPNTSRIVMLLPGDDKILCGCGKVNPKVPTEFPGVHVVKTGLNRATILLDKASFDDYNQQDSYNR